MVCSCASSSVMIARRKAAIMAKKQENKSPSIPLIIKEPSGTAINNISRSGRFRLSSEAAAAGSNVFFSIGKSHLDFIFGLIFIDRIKRSGTLRLEILKFN